MEQSFVQRLARQAVASERELEEVLRRIEEETEAERNLEKVETSFREATEDGVLDPEERQRLEALLEKAGLSGLGLGVALPHDAELRGEALASLKEKMQTLVGQARARLGSDPLLDLKRNRLLDDVRTAYQLASNVMRVEHEIGMAIIANMKA